LGRFQARAPFRLCTRKPAAEAGRFCASFRGLKTPAPSACKGPVVLTSEPNRPWKNHFSRRLRKDSRTVHYLAWSSTEINIANQSRGKICCESSGAWAPRLPPTFIASLTRALSMPSPQLQARHSAIRGHFLRRTRSRVPHPKRDFVRRTRDHPERSWPPGLHLRATPGAAHVAS
jgi:hypothetical protein